MGFVFKCRSVKAQRWLWINNGHHLGYTWCMKGSCLERGHMSDKHEGGLPRCERLHTDDKRTVGIMWEGSKWPIVVTVMIMQLDSHVCEPGSSLVFTTSSYQLFYICTRSYTGLDLRLINCNWERWAMASKVLYLYCFLFFVELLCGLICFVSTHHFSLPRLLYEQIITIYKKLV